MSTAAANEEVQATEINTSQLKSFAQAARRQLLEQVEGRLQQVLAEGSLARRENAAAVEELEKQIAAASRQQVIERVAYTWFNRFCALRFMDANRYTTLGTVSPAEGYSQPEILADAKQGVIDADWGIDQAQVLGLLDGSLPSTSPEQEAYRLLLVAVCNRFHAYMPFMFEKIADYTELLLPGDLLSENSVLTQTCQVLSADACQNVEVIGWLYQFYISEKKDEVIGKVVKSEDIPAATQLFTPNWIVKYMVQNSLGAQWLATYPQSPLKGQMEYYIEPAEQTDEVNAQLAAITPSQVNPETLTLIDPASGSGHILVEAYELFKAIYLERGYQKRDVPQLILEKNLFGLDIDERAAQLTGFALMMKGRADDRRLFERGVKLNVMALVDSAGFDAEGLAQNEQMRVEPSDYGLKPGDLTELKRLFEHATTFGSLIQVPEGLAEKLPALKQLSEATSQDLFVSEALKRLGPLVQQAELLAAQYDAVVANPPYMGGKAMNGEVKNFAKDRFPDAKSDLFACFMERALSLVVENGCYSLITMPSWLFLSSFKKLREILFANSTVSSLLHMGRGIFGIDFGSVAFVVQKRKIPTALGRYFRLHKRNFQHIHIPDIAQLFRNTLKDKTFKYDFSCYRGPELGTQIPFQSMPHGAQIHFLAKQADFSQIPGSPVAYWMTKATFSAFAFPSLGEVGSVTQGLLTTNNDRFLRRWFEVPEGNVGYGLSRTAARSSGLRWFPINKGGAYRKWYGNLEFVVDWQNDGETLHQVVINKYPYLKGKSGLVLKKTNPYFEPAATWSDVSSTHFGARFLPPGLLYEKGGSAAVWHTPEATTALLASKIAQHFLGLLNPTLHFQVGDIAALPIPELMAVVAHRSTTMELIAVSVRDWDAYERSWDFQSLPILTASSEPTPTLEESYTAWTRANKGTIAEMKRLEEENNRLFIDAYGLADELTPDVPPEQITLTVNPAYRYGGKLSEEEQWTRFRQDTMEELVSYAVGCMLGRYSLDKPGLILANAGETIDDYLNHIPEPTFMPDDDNVIPLLDGEWFTDDITGRLKEFLKVTFGTDNYEENLTFLENSLYPENLKGKKRKTIRDYFLKEFYNHHIKTYKKRPIYWLFSSPKGTFNALIYLHRYRSDTVSVVLSYLRDFQAKLTAQMEHLQRVADSGGSSQKEKAKALKEINNLKKELKEIEDYERDTLYPLATAQVELDLDDGVKVNYNKLGKALKKVTGLSGK